MAQNESAYSLTPPMHCLSASTPIDALGEDEEPESQLNGDNPSPAEAKVDYFCCVCTGRSHVQKYINSDKICIILVLACFICLILCIAGAKLFLATRKYESDLPNVLDLKGISQSSTSTYITKTSPLPLIEVTSERSVFETEKQATTSLDVLQAMPTSNSSFKRSYNFSFSNFPSSAVSSTTKLLLSTVKEISTQSLSTAEHNVITTQEFTATTTLSPESGHARRCNESEKSYCVNGGVCYYIDGINKLSCKCQPGFFGQRCLETEPLRTYKPDLKAEELYQKRVLTITGICVALLVVGIVCVVAYCKTKKQRKKMHSHLRQNLCVDHQNRNLANGPNHPGPLPEDIQMVDYISKNVPAPEHVRRHETETSFSASQPSSTSHHSSTATHTSSHRNGDHTWSIDRTESGTSEMHSGMMTSSLETSKCNSPLEPRGRLSAVCSHHDTRHPIFHCRDSVDSLRDSPHSDRYVSALTTPARLSPVDLHYSLPSYAPVFEMSPRGSTHVTTLPPAAVGYTVEDEQPLLRRYHKYQQDNQRHDPYKQRHSYLHDSFGSLPPSPMRVAEDDEYETTQEYIPALDRPKKTANSSRRWRKTKPNGHISHRSECDCDSNSESCCSDTDSDGEKAGEHTPFLSTQNPAAANTETASVFRSSDSRTHSSNRHNVREDLHTRVTRVKSNQDSIPV
ncbi:pro-neuregulin-1, membrane-bound isoform-like isoform X2 [Chiloscyllium punctatum]|uniref:pro-neuregulin-1, membrane-bound isoform-like isoform X2 n=1 Tax=Chiloscyllium punctatum TaxID=137246 RepID=UPI003B63B3A7